MIKQMILLDLDGTLLTSDNLVSSITINAINACKSKGYHIGLITARSKSKKNIQLLNELPYDFAAFYNGAKIYAKNHLIESNVLPYKQVSLMLQKLNNDFPGMIFDVHQEPWNFSSVRGDIRHMKLGYRKICSLNNLPECNVQRIRLELNSRLSIPLQNYLIPESTFYYTTYGDAIIVHKKANKGHATQKASDFFNIPLTQMIAFGDDINDIDMLKIVGTGVAMGNAIPNVKRIAKYVTETNNNNGVAVWINKHIVQ